MTRPEFSLVVATLARTHEPERLLASLQAQTLRTFEILLMDQNADGRLVTVVRKARRAGLLIRHVRLPQPDQARARNLGLRMARAPRIAFPDDDCWYEADVLEQALARWPTGPDGAGVVARWVELGAGAPASDIAWRDLRRLRSCDVSAITLFLDRQRLLALGGFDDRLGLGRWFGGSEETDLVMRLVRSGGILRVEPDIRVHHPVNDAERPLAAHRSRARGIGALWARHGLSPVVVARGLAAPPLKALASRLAGHRTGNSRPGLAAALSVSLGRLEGFLGWHWRHGRWMPDPPRQAPCRANRQPPRPRVLVGREA